MQAQRKIEMKVAWSEVAKQLNVDWIVVWDLGEGAREKGIVF